MSPIKPGSIAKVISPSSITFGRKARTRAMATLCCRPPDGCSRNWFNRIDAPQLPTYSSRENARCNGRGSSDAANSGTTTGEQAWKPFMSAVPRPNSFPFRRNISNGAVIQSCPAAGTTSVCPERTVPPSTSGPMVASRFAFSPRSSVLSNTLTPKGSSSRQRGRPLPCGMQPTPFRSQSTRPAGRSSDPAAQL